MLFPGRSSKACLLNDYDLCSTIASDVSQCKYGWGSFHTSGINFLLCDGSVRIISTSINMTVFCGLATIAYGEEIPGF